MTRRVSRAATAKHAMVLVIANTTARAVKAVLGGHVKMTTANARVNARFAWIKIAIVTLTAVLVVAESATIRKHKLVVSV
jgi:hypothetical protein